MIIENIENYNYKFFIQYNIYYKMDKRTILNLITEKEKQIQSLNDERTKLEIELKMLKERSKHIFLNWLGEYKNSIILGETTAMCEEINMKKDYIFLVNNDSEYYTTKIIVGLDMQSNWNDSTNGTIIFS